MLIAAISAAGLIACVVGFFAWIFLVEEPANMERMRRAKLRKAGDNGEG